MRGLYEIYGREGIVGRLWIDQSDLESMRQRGDIRVLIEDGLPLVPLAPTPYAGMKMETLTLWLRWDGRSRSWRVHTDGTAQQVKRARERQEHYFRFPVPISLLPG